MPLHAQVAQQTEQPATGLPAAEHSNSATRSGDTNSFTRNPTAPAHGPLPWTNTDGKTIQAEFVRISSDAVVILKDGKEFSIPLAKLSSASRKQAGECAAATTPADPSAYQYGLYIHFITPTFGPGHLPADKFAPTDLDMPGWARVAKENGMTFAVFTAKHESGFCLWESAGYDYDVFHSPVKKDLVAGFVTACKAEGIVPGVHYSIPDALNEGEVKFKGPVGQSYYSVIKKHLTELLTLHPDLRLILSISPAPIKLPDCGAESAHETPEPEVRGSGGRQIPRRI